MIQAIVRFGLLPAFPGQTAYYDSIPLHRSAPFLAAPDCQPAHGRAHPYRPGSGN